MTLFMSVGKCHLQSAYSQKYSYRLIGLLLETFVPLNALENHFQNVLKIDFIQPFSGTDNFKLAIAILVTIHIAADILNTRKTSLKNFFVKLLFRPSS